MTPVPPPTRENRRRAAIHYTRLGYAILPCAENGKLPTTRHGKDDATTDPDEIDGLIVTGGNLGILPPAHVFVIDVDVPKPEQRPGATDQERQAEATQRSQTLRDTFPETDGVIAQSRSGGYHHHVRLPIGAQRLACCEFPKRDPDPWGEIRGMGRTYVLASPSVIDGRAYYWLKRPIHVDNLPEATPELLEFLVPPRTPRPRPKATQRVTNTVGDAYAVAALEGELAEVRKAGPGSRNTVLNRAAFSLGTLVGAGALDRAQVAQDLLDAALGAKHPLPTSEAVSTIARGLTAGTRHPREGVA